MKARVPLDVDMEDKLLYGLTPVRLAYVVVALLAGFAIWSSRWAPSPVRAVACLALVGLGAGTAWGRWRGRPVDAWLTDIGVFVTNAYRVRWDRRWVNGLTNRFRGIALAEKLPAPVAIPVNARRPGAGASKVVVELAKCLPSTGDAVELKGDEGPVGIPVDPSAAITWIRQADGPQKRSASSDLLTPVAAADSGTMCYPDSGDGHHGAALITEDDCKRQAGVLKEATVVVFPNAPASRALRELADVVIGAR